MTQREGAGVTVRGLRVAGLIDHVDFALPGGQCLAILDEDDARRTALLRCLAGDWEPDAGTISAPPAAAVWHDDGLPEQTAVIDTLTERLGSTDAASRLLDGLGLGHRAAHEPWAMSAGERRRIAVELAFRSGCGLILLDEPERGLDKAAVRSLARRIREVTVSGAAVVLATHNEWLADTAGDVVVDEI